MAMILRKVWGSMLSRPVSSGSNRRYPFEIGNSSSSSSRENSSLLLSSMGAFDRLPTDILMLLLRLLGSRDAARMGAVCRSWRVLVSDNMLWIFFIKNEGEESFDSVLFAETHLRLGFPCRIYFGHSPQLSFMNIYAKRQQVAGSIIIDGGSGYCKYGWSKYTSPSGRCATFLEFGNIESPMYSRLRHFFSTIYTRMQVKPSSQPIIVSIPICHSDDTESARASRGQLKEAIHSVLFDLNVPAVCAIDQGAEVLQKAVSGEILHAVKDILGDKAPGLAVLALYAAKRTSGIVVNVGFHVTSIVPILQGRVMREVGVETIGLGALKVTGYLRELMQQRNINFESLYTVRTIKEKLCYVAADYNAELRKDTRASCQVAGEGLFTLSKERFQAAEILFQPQIGGVRAMGLHRAVALCMDHCIVAEVAVDEGWYKTVVLAGGTACLPGLPERLEKELQKNLPTYMSEGIKVIPPPYGADSAWFGAKIVSNVSTFSEAWCMSKKHFRQKSRSNMSSFNAPW